MDLFLAFLGGVSCKMYDDLNDMDIIHSDKLNEALKGLQWIILSVLSIHDFNFAMIIYTVNLINSFVNSKEWSEPYEFTGLYVFPILLLLSFHTRTYFSVFDILLFVGFILIASIEPFIFTEETSYSKLISRIICAILLIILVLKSSHGISQSVLKCLYYSLAYFITSSFFQVYKVPQDIKGKTTVLTFISEVVPSNLI